MRYGLKESSIEQIHTILARYPQVEKAILYGSRAKGDYKPGSDIDLALVGSEDLTLDLLHRIMDDIDDLLLPYTIDLSLFHQINDVDVINHIRRVGKLFYERSPEKTHA